MGASWGASGQPGLSPSHFAGASGRRKWTAWPEPFAFCRKLSERSAQLEIFGLLERLIRAQVDRAQVSTSLATIPSCAWAVCAILEAATNAAGTCGRTVCFPARCRKATRGPRSSWVEQNPVRALLAASPEEYPWSSARAHLTGEPEMPQVLDRQFWETSGGSERWQQMH